MRRRTGDERSDPPFRLGRHLLFWVVRARSKALIAVITLIVEEGIVFASDPLSFHFWRSCCSISEEILETSTYSQKSQSRPPLCSRGHC